MRLLSKITFGNVLSVITIIGALIGSYVVMKSDIEVLKADNTNIRREVALIKESQDKAHDETTDQINQVRLDLRAIYSAIISQSNDHKKSNNASYNGL